MLQTPTVMVPVDWKIEMPVLGDQDERFGGCASIEGRYTKVKQIGEGTYGQVSAVHEYWRATTSVERMVQHEGPACFAYGTCACWLHPSMSGTIRTLPVSG